MAVEVSLWGPRLVGAHKYLGGAPSACGGLLLGVPAHARRVVTLDLRDGSVGSLVGVVGRRNYKWLRGVLARDGAVYCIPACAEAVLRISEQGELSYLGEGELPAANAGEWRWHGGALGADGSVYAIPANAERVLRIVVERQEVELIGPRLHPGLKNKWYGGIRASDGTIWGMPYNAPSCLRINPTTGEVREIGTFPVGGWKWHGGCRSTCGKYIIGIPSHAAAVLRIDTAACKVDLLPTGLSGNYKWGGGVADALGNVWAIPSDAAFVAKIVPATGEVALIGGLPATRNKWQGGVLGRDGNVYCIPCDASSVLCIHTATGMLSVHGNLGDSKMKFQGAHTAPDGIIWGLPENCQHVLRIVPPVSDWNPEPLAALTMDGPTVVESVGLDGHRKGIQGGQANDGVGAFDSPHAAAAGGLEGSVAVTNGTRNLQEVFLFHDNAGGMVSTWRVGVVEHEAASTLQRTLRRRRLRAMGRRMAAAVLSRRMSDSNANTNTWLSVAALRLTCATVSSSQGTPTSETTASSRPCSAIARPTLVSRGALASVCSALRQCIIADESGCPHTVPTTARFGRRRARRRRVGEQWNTFAAGRFGDADAVAARVWQGATSTSARHAVAERCNEAAANERASTVAPHPRVNSLALALSEAFLADLPTAARARKVRRPQKMDDKRGMIKDSAGREGVQPTAPPDELREAKLYDPVERLAALVRVELLLTRKRLRVFAVGGAAACAALALPALVDFLRSPLQKLELTIAEADPTWRSVIQAIYNSPVPAEGSSCIAGNVSPEDGLACCRWGSIHASDPLRASTARISSCELRFLSADMALPLDAPANAELAAYIQDGGSLAVGADLSDFDVLILSTDASPGRRHQVAEGPRATDPEGACPGHGRRYHDAIAPLGASLAHLFGVGRHPPAGRSVVTKMACRESRPQIEAWARLPPPMSLAHISGDAHSRQAATSGGLMAVEHAACYVHAAADAIHRVLDSAGAKTSATSNGNPDVSANIDVGPTTTTSDSVTAAAATAPGMPSCHSQMFLKTSNSPSGRPTATVEHHANSVLHTAAAVVLEASEAKDRAGGEAATLAASAALNAARAAAAVASRRVEKSARTSHHVSTAEPPSSGGETQRPQASLVYANGVENRSAGEISDVASTWACNFGLLVRSIVTCSLEPLRPVLRPVSTWHAASCTRPRAADVPEHRSQMALGPGASEEQGNPSDRNQTQIGGRSIAPRSCNDSVKTRSCDPSSDSTFSLLLGAGLAESMLGLLGMQGSGASFGGDSPLHSQRGGSPSGNYSSSPSGCVQGLYPGYLGGSGADAPVLAGEDGEEKLGATMAAMQQQLWDLAHSLEGSSTAETRMQGQLDLAMQSRLGASETDRVSGWAGSAVGIDVDIETEGVHNIQRGEADEASRPNTTCAVAAPHETFETGAEIAQHASATGGEDVVCFHESNDFSWEDLRGRALPILRAQVLEAKAAADAESIARAVDLDAAEACQTATAPAADVDAPVVFGMDASTHLGPSPPVVTDGVADDTTGQIQGWERHFQRHAAAPTPFFKERRALLQMFPQLRAKSTPEGAMIEGTSSALDAKTGAKPLRVLELGCGNGSSVLPLLRGNPEAFVHATDPSQTAVADTRRRVIEAGLDERFSAEVQPGPTTACSHGHMPFDIAMILFTLSAIPGEDDLALLRSAASCLRAGGFVLIRDHGLYDMRHLRDARRGARCVDERRPAFIRPGGMHRRYYSLEDIDQLAIDAGLHIEERRYLCIRLRNERKNVNMDRVYIHAVLRKPV